MSTALTSLRSGLLAGDRIALAQAITLIESTTAADQKAGDELLRSLPQTTTSIRIAISGAPGVGKSTFIDTFGKRLVDAGRKVAVLAIDPSSRATGGSILGDKTRMEKLGRDANAFIRPSPSMGILGGLSQSTYEVSQLCEAAGYDYIIMETVGVGQSEILAHHLSDLFIVLIQPGAGDDLQGMKKGIVEMADLMIVNKWDGDLKIKAEEAKDAYQQVWRRFGKEILLCSSTQNLGFDLILNAISELAHQIDFTKQKRERDIFWFKESFKRRLMEKIFADHDNLINRLAGAVGSTEIHYTTAIEEAVLKVLS